MEKKQNQKQRGPLLVTANLRYYEGVPSVSLEGDTCEDNAREVASMVLEMLAMQNEDAIIEACMCFMNARGFHITSYDHHS